MLSKNLCNPNYISIVLPTINKVRNKSNEMSVLFTLSLYLVSVKCMICLEIIS